jgi:butyrate kinase
MDIIKILSINPGSTSTKIAVTHNETFVYKKNITHHSAELSVFKNISSQFEFRKNIILNELNKANIDINEINAVIGRGGLIHPVKGGVYEVNEKMADDLEKGLMGQHASNLGGLIALNISKSIPNAKAFIADPVVVDELNDIARISGHPDIERISIFHALNHKAVARKFAELQKTKYEKLNLVIAHLGGGISIGAHHKGKVIDVNNALNGDGPFSPERTGGLPAGQLLQLCFEKKNYSDLKKQITQSGGLTAYLNTNSIEQVEKLIKENNSKAELILKALAYQTSKYIGEMATVLHGNVDAILLTGGIANSKYVTNYIKQMVEFISPVFIFPGENEMYSLAMNGLLVMRGEIECNVYDY